MTTQSTALQVSFATEYAVKVGKNVKMFSPEAIMVAGGAQAANLLKEAGFALALTKARNGSFRAAVEIIGFAASPAQVKAMTPPEKNGQITWTKARVMALAELVMERATPAKGWSPKALKGRMMCQLMIDIDKQPQPVTPAEVATDAKDVSKTANTGDVLAGLEEAPM